MSEIAAKTVFETGPDATVAAVDVYSPVPTGPVNNGETVVTQTPAPSPVPPKISMSDVVTKVPSVVKDSLERVKSVTGGVAGISSDLVWAMQGGLGAKDRLQVIIDNGKDALKGIVSDATKNILSDDVRVIIDGIENIRKTGDLNSAAGVMNVLGQITGNPAFASVDIVGDKLGALGAIATNIAVLRIPELIDTVLDQIENEKEKKQYLIDNLDAFVVASDFYSINKTIDSAGSAAVLAKMPNIVVRILMFYRLPNGQDSPTVAAANQLNDLLNRLDSSWLEYRRNGVSISNLEPFGSANPLAVNVLKLIPAYLVQTTICKNYLTRDLVDLGRQYYPQAALMR